jgi:hypothetical protein
MTLVTIRVMANQGFIRIAGFGETYWLDPPQDANTLQGGPKVRAVQMNLANPEYFSNVFFQSRSTLVVESRDMF